MTGSVVRVGITDYAQDALGDVVFVQLPTVGAVFEAQQGLGEIESTKSVSDVYAPVAGTITAVNDMLTDQPELLNSDPYGQGWMCEIDASHIDESYLMSAEEYSSLTGSG